MLGLPVSFKPLFRDEDSYRIDSPRKAKRRYIIVVKDAPCQRCGPLHIRCSLIYHDEQPHPLNGSSVSNSTTLEVQENLNLTPQIVDRAILYQDLLWMVLAAISRSSPLKASAPLALRVTDMFREPIGGDRVQFVGIDINLNSTRYLSSPGKC